MDELEKRIDILEGQLADLCKYVIKIQNTIGMLEEAVLTLQEVTITKMRSDVNDKS